MNLSYLIRKNYLKESWRTELSKERLNKAYDLMKKRAERNEVLDLIDCLEFCDKRDLILKNQECLNVFTPDSKSKIERKLRAIENLRDLVAHAQDLCSRSSWEEVIDTVSDTKEMILKCEGV